MKPHPEWPTRHDPEHLRGLELPAHPEAVDNIRKGTSKETRIVARGDGLLVLKPPTRKRYRQGV